MSDDEVIERAARAACDDECRRTFIKCGGVASQKDLDEEWATSGDQFLAWITAALSSLRAGDTLPNGLVVEHMEPMERAAWEYAREAMRNAAKEG